MVSVEGPLALRGPAHLAATLAPGAQAVPRHDAAGNRSGRGVVRLDVTRPVRFHVQRETAITSAPRADPDLVSGRELAPGAEGSSRPRPTGSCLGTWRATASFGGAVRYDVAGLVRALSAIP